MVKSELIQALNASYPVLAGFFDQYWETPLNKYSESLYHNKAITFETELEEAFVEEWLEQGFSSDSAYAFLDNLKNRPVLQTSHHVTPTNGPTFLAYDLVSLAGLSKDDVYFVAANSGVAFSNAAWSGAVNYGDIPTEELLDSKKPLYHKTLKASKDREQDGTSDRRISLIPSKQRDQLVFGTDLTSHQTEIYQQFSSALKSQIGLPEVSRSYSSWACRVCSSIQQKVFDRSNIVYFDINRVISNYLIKILTSKDDHPLVSLLFDNGITTVFNKLFDHPNLFLGSYKSKKSIKIETLSWANSGTIGSKSGEQTYGRESLARTLRDKKICPGILLQFLVLRFMNGVKCLGSFNQIGYLEEYRNKWESLSLPWDLKLEEDEGISLTTGRLTRDGKARWPLDLVWNQERIDVAEYGELPMSEFWMPIALQLAK